MTRDDDFQQRSMLLGAPPKVVYLINAQGDPNGLALFVAQNLKTLDQFMKDLESSLLIIGR